MNGVYVMPKYGADAIVFAEALGALAASDEDWMMIKDPRYQDSPLA